MKRVSVITLLLFYLLSMTGVSLMLHYCRGEVSDVSLVFNSHQCPCGENSKKSCCHNDYVYLKLKSAHQVNSANFFKDFSKIIVVTPMLVLHPVVNTPDVEHAFAHAPPFKVKEPAYIFSGSLLI